MKSNVLITILVAALLAAPAFASDADRVSRQLQRQYLSELVGRGVYIIRSAAGKYGLAGADNRSPPRLTGVLVEPKYDWIDSFDFETNTASVQTALRYGLISSNGQEIIPLQYDFVTPCNNGVSRAYLGGKVGLFDCAGRMIAPLEYDWIGRIDSSNSGLVEATKNGRFGVISLAGGEIIQFTKRFILMMAGYPLVIEDDRSPARQYNRRGQPFLTGAQRVSAATNGQVIVTENRKYGLFDDAGAQILPIEYDLIDCTSSVQTGNCTTRRGDVEQVFNVRTRSFVANMSGSEVSACGQLTAVSSRSSGGPYRFLRPDGQRAFQEEYSEFAFCQDDLIFVERGSSWGGIDADGRVIIPFTIQSDSGVPAVNVVGELLGVRTSSGSGVYDRGGRVIVPPIYSRIVGDHVGLDITGWPRMSPVVERSTSRRGVINADGSWALPLGQYEDLGVITAVNDDHVLIPVKQGGRWGIFNLATRTEIVSPAYDFVNLSTDSALVTPVRGGPSSTLTYNDLVVHRPPTSLEFHVYFGEGQSWVRRFDPARRVYMSGIVDFQGRTIVPVDVDDFSGWFGRGSDGSWGLLYYYAMRGDQTALFDRAGRAVIPWASRNTQTLGRYKYGFYRDGCIDLGRGSEVQLFRMPQGRMIARSSDFQATGIHGLSCDTVGPLNVQLATMYDRDGDSAQRRQYNMILNDVLYTEVANDGRSDSLPERVVFTEGLLAARRNGKWGFLDASGHEAIAFQYDEIRRFENGVAFVKKDGRWSAINRLGVAFPFMNLELSSLIRASSGAPTSR